MDRDEESRARRIGIQQLELDGNLGIIAAREPCECIAVTERDQPRTASLSLMAPVTRVSPLTN